MTDLNITLWCIHGNLQLPEVWDSFQSALTIRDNAGQTIATTVIKENLWLSLAGNIAQWTTTFCNYVRESTSETKPYLLGYSLGGRLALHAAIRSPDIFKGVIIVSADPGLKNDCDRDVQLAKDIDWGLRFISEPWDKLIEGWDNQAIFKNSMNVAIRNESDYSREKIALMFDVYSKGRQDDLILELSKLEGPPILYVSGSRDEKYCEIGNELSQKCPSVSHKVIEIAGHRVPWDNPGRFVKSVQNFMSGVEIH